MGQQESKPGKKISVVIVDDHQIFRQGIEANLELHDDLQVVGQGGNGHEALKIIQEKQPDVTIMDINLPLMNGIQVTREVTNLYPGIRVIMVTAFDDPEQVLHALRAGAAAFCPKDIVPDQLVEIIRLVVNGHYVVDNTVFDAEGIQEWMVRGVEAIAGPYYAELAESYSPLSPREMEILRYVTQGMSNMEIAQHLNISHQTVKNHMTSILRKLAVEDRTQAAVFALRRGWVRLRDTISPDDLSSGEG